MRFQRTITYEIEAPSLGEAEEVWAASGPEIETWESIEEVEVGELSPVPANTNHVAYFTSMLAVNYDATCESPEDALATYLADHNITPSYELTGVEPSRPDH